MDVPQGSIVGRCVVEVLLLGTTVLVHGSPPPLREPLRRWTHSGPDLSSLSLESTAKFLCDSPGPTAGVGRKDTR